MRACTIMHIHPTLKLSFDQPNVFQTLVKRWSKVFQTSFKRHSKRWSNVIQNVGQTSFKTSFKRHSKRWSKSVNSSNCCMCLFRPAPRHVTTHRSIHKWSNSQLKLIYIYIYIYACIYVYVHIHTHTYMYIIVFRPCASRPAHAPCTRKPQHVTISLPAHCQP
jgi:hypothetical protein